MIRKKTQDERDTADGVNAYIGKKVTFEGKIRFEGMFRIDGKYDGEIVSGDSLVVGETAEINAQINVNVLTVHGKVNGNIKAKKRVSIFPPGKILGDIETPVFAIAEGAVFDGNCHMEKQQRDLEEKVSSLKIKEKGQADREIGETVK
jgi:cytoskeletal protein CcmA (bactofilin family)